MRETGKEGEGEEGREMGEGKNEKKFCAEPLPQLLSLSGSSKKWQWSGSLFTRWPEEAHFIPNKYLGMMVSHSVAPLKSSADKQCGNSGC